MPAVIVDPARALPPAGHPASRLDDGLVGVWDEWSKAEVTAPATR